MFKSKNRLPNTWITSTSRDLHGPFTFFRTTLQDTYYIVLRFNPTNNINYNRKISDSTSLLSVLAHLRPRLSSAGREEKRSPKRIKLVSWGPTVLCHMVMVKKVNFSCQSFQEKQGVLQDWIVSKVQTCIF